LSTPPTSHEEIKNYLLGQVSEQEESEVEMRLLADPEFYDELSIVEDELIDQYLGNTLSDTERQSFQSHFVSSPERHQKVRFARALKKYVAVNAEEEASPRASSIFSLRHPVLPYAIAAVLLVVVGVSYLAMKYGPGPPPGSRVLAIELTPAPTVRGGGEVKELSLAPDVGSVRLQLDLPTNDYQTYDAVLRDSSLRSVLTAGGLKPQTINNTPAVIIDVEAGLLAPGDYRVNLSGTTAGGGSESVATFSFTVRAN
jgi:hypothetical protein